MPPVRLAVPSTVASSPAAASAAAASSPPRRPRPPLYPHPRRAALPLPLLPPSAASPPSPPPSPPSPPPSPPSPSPGPAHHAYMTDLSPPPRPAARPAPLKDAPLSPTSPTSPTSPPAASPTEPGLNSPLSGAGPDADATAAPAAAPGETGDAATGDAALCADAAPPPLVPPGFEPLPRAGHAAVGGRTAAMYDAPCMDSLASPATDCDGPSPSSPPLRRCASCDRLRKETALAKRRLARLHQRHKVEMETHRTHGQRLLRAHYSQKLTEVMDENIANTTSILNQQKKCFEDELEVMEDEARGREAALRVELDEERTRCLRMEADFNREREVALEKADETMQAVQRKLAQLHARATRLEMEKNAVENSLIEKGMALDVLTTSLEERGVEKRRMQLIVRNADDERVRKDKVIEALQQEVSGLRERLTAEDEINVELRKKMTDADTKRQEERAKLEKEMADVKLNARKESERLGILFGSVIQDFATAQSDVSTAESDGRGRMNMAQDEKAADSD